MTLSDRFRNCLASAIPVLLILCTPILPAKAQSLGIAAVVNEGAITVLDLQARIELALLNSGLPPNNEQRQRLAGAVLRELIDEELQRQKIEEAGIEIEERFIKEAIEQTAAQNNLSADQFSQILRRRGIPVETLESQIRVNLGWLRLIGRQFRRLAEVSDEEIEEVYSNLQDGMDEEQERVSEILLQIATPDQEQEVRQFADRLVGQLRSGASFPGLARQFSASPSAQSGGALGWISRDAMNDDLLSVVPGMSPGEVSEPIRTLSGYLIVRLEQRGSPFGGQARPETLEISQVFLQVRQNDPEKAADVQEARLERVIQEATSCADMAQLAEELNSPVAADLGKMAAQDLQPDIRAAVIDLPNGQPSGIIELPAGRMVAMICNREGGEAVLPTREQIEERLQTQKLNIFGRRLLRDSRRAAFIDNRL